jgi:hypothetical protein
MLAQTQTYEDCHGTYAYQCIQEKVDKVLHHMELDVEEHETMCLEKATEIRTDIRISIMTLRDELQTSLTETRSMSMTRLEEKIESAKTTIQTAYEVAKSGICGEADDRMQDTSEISKYRIKIENQIKKLYYEDQSGYNTSDLREKINHKIEIFKQWVGDNGMSFDNMFEFEVAKFTQVVTTEINCIEELIIEVIDEWNTKAELKRTSLQNAIELKLTEMDGVI